MLHAATNAGPAPSQAHRRGTPARRTAIIQATRAFDARPQAPYQRSQDLPRLIGLWPSELADTSLAGTAHILSKLRRSLREERRRGLAGHWTYDLVRHAALLRAFRAEAEAYSHLVVRRSGARETQVATR